MIDLTISKNRTQYKWKAGIYAIKNKINNKYYIGSSINIGKRVMDHLSNLRRDVHTNVHLQRSWNKNTENNFELFILELIENENENENDLKLRQSEKKWLDHFDAYKNGFNRSLTTETASGFTYKHSEETKKLLSDMKKGKRFSEEHKENLSSARKSYQQSPETILKTKIKNTGKKRSIESIQKIKSKRIENIEKANKTMRQKSARGKSGFKGVYQHRDKWQAKITMPDKKDKSVGSFNNCIDAAHNYDYHMLNLYGNHCFLNFPNFNYVNFIPKKTIAKSSKDFAIVSVVYNPNL